MSMLGMDAAGESPDGGAEPLAPTASGVLAAPVGSGFDNARPATSSSGGSRGSLMLKESAGQQASQDPSAL